MAIRRSADGRDVPAACCRDILFRRNPFDAVGLDDLLQQRELVRGEIRQRRAHRPGFCPSTRRPALMIETAYPFLRLRKATKGKKKLFRISSTVA